MLPVFSTAFSFFCIYACTDTTIILNLEHVEVKTYRRIKSSSVTKKEQVPRYGTDLISDIQK
jgi:hypothetical protein